MFVSRYAVNTYRFSGLFSTCIEMEGVLITALPVEE
jgi:hypothetical protein